MPSTFTMALSLVMTSWVGTSSTCSIMFIRRPMRSTNGVNRLMPGLRVRVYLPKRSTVYSRPWGTILTTLNSSTKARTTSATTKRTDISIKEPPNPVQVIRPGGGRHRNRTGGS